MKTYAWHFLNGNKLRDGRDAPEDGVPLIYDGPVKICESGLHASKRLIDALTYAPGCTLCLVECEDIHEEHGDKLVCSKRTILWQIPEERMKRVLVWFAYWCAAAAAAARAAADAAADAYAARAAAYAGNVDAYAARAAAYAADAAYAARAAAYAADAADAAREEQNEELLRLIELAR